MDATALTTTDDRLTHKQRLFVEAYIGDSRGNATDAARRAGYDGTAASLRRIGSENLRKPHIAAYVRAVARAVMGEHEIIEHLAAMIRKDDLEYAQEYRNKHGETVGVRLDLNAKVKAIELMMKYHGMLTD
jgi:phage terminase small subunit